MSDNLFVCLIDDDQIYQFTAKKMLEATNLTDQVIVFSEGKEALDFIQENVDSPESLPDVIFLDINMPHMDGWEFLEEYVKMKPNLPKQITIYMVSTSVDEKDVSRAKRISDISDYIFKPITKDRFAEALQGLL